MSVSLCYPSQQEQPFFDDFFADSWRDAGRDAPRGMRSMTCCAMAWKASVTLTSALAEASMKRTSYSAASAWPYAAADAQSRFRPRPKRSSRQLRHPGVAA